MNSIPKDLDLSPVVGEFTTQLRVGQFDLQFTLGDFNFMAWSPVNLFRAGELIAHWEECRWPDPGFYEIMNTKVIRYEVANDRLIILEFANAIEMHLEVISEDRDSLQITSVKHPSQWWIF